MPFEERAVECNMTGLRVLLRGDAQQRPPDVHRVAVEGMVERGWIRWGIRVDAELVADRWHKAHPINEFGVAVTLFFANAVCDDVGLAGKPARLGLARSVSQSLFSDAQCSLNEVKQCDSHNRLLDLAFSNSLRSSGGAVFHFQ